MSDELAFLSGLDQAALVRRGEVSAAELHALSLERIERLDPALAAFVTTCPYSEPADGPLRGVPVSVKDLSETAGVRTTFSCRAFADYVPEVDGAPVRRLREAGTVLLGKTNTPELGARPVTESILNGDCRNPWNTALTPGGSSGGAGAALAAGLGSLALASDGGGSIRIPASCCGVVGLKPSRGRVSMGPRMGHVLEGYATAGPMARTVRDTAALLDAISGYEPGDPYWAPPPERSFLAEAGTPPGRLRVGYTTEPPRPAEVDPACVVALEDAARLLEQLGHHVEPAAPDWHDPGFSDLFTRVWQGGAALYADVPDDELEPLNRALRDGAREVSSLEYEQAVFALGALARRTVAFWQDHDLLLTPTLALPPVPIGWTFGGGPWDEFERGWLFAPFTQIANLTGQPAISLPLYRSAGLPIGVQLIGPPAGEALLVRVAAQLEEARPWSGLRPPLTA